MRDQINNRNFIGFQQTKYYAILGRRNGPLNLELHIILCIVSCTYVENPLYNQHHTFLKNIFL